MPNPTPAPGHRVVAIQPAAKRMLERIADHHGTTHADVVRHLLTREIARLGLPLELPGLEIVEEPAGFRVIAAGRTIGLDFSEAAQIRSGLRGLLEHVVEEVRTENFRAHRSTRSVQLSFPAIGFEAREVYHSCEILLDLLAAGQRPCEVLVGRRPFGVPGGPERTEEQRRADVAACNRRTRERGYRQPRRAELSPEERERRRAADRVRRLAYIERERALPAEERAARAAKRRQRNARAQAAYRARQRAARHPA